MSMNTPSGRPVSLYTVTGNPVSLYTAGGVQVLGPAQGGGTTPTAPDDATGLTSRLVQVTDNAFKAPFGADADLTAGSTSFTPVTFQARAHKVQFLLTGETVGARAGLTVRGITYPITVGGAQTFNVPSGTDLGILTDPFDYGIVFAEGETVTLRRYTPPGYKVWNSKAQAPSPVIRGDRSLVGEPPLATTPGRMAAPLAAVGVTTTDHRAVLFMGDSMMDPPWARNAATANGLAYTDHAQFGIQIYTLDPTFGGKFPATSTPYHYFLWELGTNNGGMGQPGSYQAAITSMYRLADAGIRGGQTTLAPRTSSTDAWATVGSQTASQAPAWREDWNAWVRDGSPIDNATSRKWVAPGTAGALRAGQAGHFLAYPACDVASAVETGTAANRVWKAGKLTGDGTHYTGAGAVLAEQYTTEWMRQHLTAGA